ncbi:MAG: hypothetical protein ABFR53_01155 [Actinomycetota bacterium]
MVQRTGILVAVALIAAACTSNSAPESTTTSSFTPLTTAATATTTEPSVEEATTTTAPLSTLTPPEYAIVDRAETDAPGDTVVVLLDDETYTSLTDIDLYDIIAEVVDLFPPISKLHIVDNAGAVNTVANPEATPEEIALIEDNYFARLEDGFKITYLGPFASSGTAILGS